MTDLVTFKDNADRINLKQRMIDSALNSAVRMAVEIGDELIEVKKQLPHGEFESWCEKSVHVGKHQRQKYMRLAEAKGDRELLLQQPSIRQALDYIKEDTGKPSTTTTDKPNVNVDAFVDKLTPEQEQDLYDTLAQHRSKDFGKHLYTDWRLFTLPSPDANPQLAKMIMNAFRQYYHPDRETGDKEHILVLNKAYDNIMKQIGDRL